MPSGGDGRPDYRARPFFKPLTRTRGREEVEERASAMLISSLTTPRRYQSICSLLLSPCPPSTESLNNRSKYKTRLRGITSASVDSPLRFVGRRCVGPPLASVRFVRMRRVHPPPIDRDRPLITSQLSKQDRLLRPD